MDANSKSRFRLSALPEPEVAAPGALDQMIANTTESMRVNFERFLPRHAGHPADNPTKVPAYAAGGDVKGPGSSIGDKIPAYLSDGEFVMNARSTSVNRPFLQALNADPFFLQKMLAARSPGNESGGGGGSGRPAPGGQSATVNISMSSSEDIVGRLKVLAAQWELSH
ncbi:hypothetical protein OG203_17435 [Nocardia sp. NBC_01499]|uniref:hypothetical protein n=1 Tax=Nocardia sp. NBC_01499 TaxID=2903597 RepID=UPI0038696E73